MRDTDTGRQRHRQREKQAACRKPDAGLDPRTLGSQLEPKADALRLNHPGTSVSFDFKSKCNFNHVIFYWLPFI